MGRTATVRPSLKVTHYATDPILGVPSVPKTAQLMLTTTTVSVGFCWQPRKSHSRECDANYWSRVLTSNLVWEPCRDGVRLHPSPRKGKSAIVPSFRYTPGRNNRARLSRVSRSRPNRVPLPHTPIRPTHTGNCKPLTSVLSRISDTSVQST